MDLIRWLSALRKIHICSRVVVTLAFEPGSQLGLCTRKICLPVPNIDLNPVPNYTFSESQKSWEIDRNTRMREPPQEELSFNSHKPLVILLSFGGIAPI